MAGNVPAPPMFLPCPGEPPIPFDMWLRIFKNYLLVINATGNAWPEARRRATLLHCLGTEGQRTFYSLPDTGDSFDSAVTALEKHYTPKVNVVVERHTFRQRKQAPHETIIQYAAVLHDLASKCGFDDKTDEMIRDQLIEHVNNSNIRERLLLESDLTLDKTLTLASQVESAIQQAKTITGNDSVSVQAVQPRSQFTKKKYTQHIHPNKPFNASTTSSRSCFRCGSNTHLANSSQCPAAKATCKSCHKVGHFARVCRSSKTSDVREIQLPKLTVLYLNNTCHAPHTLTCKINISTPASLTKEHEMVVDTGSAVSILPHHIYVQYFNDTPLLPPVSQLVTYTRKRIPVLGCLQVKVSRGVLTAPVTFYVVKKGTSLLGRDLMKALSICIEVTGRKTGGIRMCTDLREPNKAVVTDCYPLPHLDVSARRAVQRHQNNMQHYTDAKRGACMPSFRPGERVRIRKPNHVPKAHPRFTSPTTVRKRIGPNSFLLSDGKIWNASHLAKIPPVAGQDCDTSRLIHTGVSHSPSHKQPRVKYKPKWLKDYVMQ
ncbi:uncharacterized protein LOC125715236 isoform X3 [Brienomyrus brachyistius]|uniref:uncharacterized protein LOC125715236 isoform X3 n=1 Tax=Brienomyrus brachyistius TaxID=42636 RepID=UPI0020B355EC|nr:uncharacterized protein LOC125715236 isoform X3 [Brienomyrus brachyistius]